MKRKPVTLITGTSRGIGLALAEHYVNQGHAVVGMSRSESPLRDSDYVHFETDITDEKSVNDCFEQIHAKFGYLSHLINNAGISSLNHGLLMPISTVRKISEVNFLAPFLLCQNAARLMREVKFGRIVNLTTVAVPLHSEGLAAYACSKAALEEMTRVLAKELGPFGITINCVGPSIVDTQLSRGLPENRRQEVVSRQTINRPGEFDDVANAVDFFLSERSGMISAQTLYLGGIV